MGYKKRKIKTHAKEKLFSRMMQKKKRREKKER
jgi:hypothetical protein